MAEALSDHPVDAHLGDEGGAVVPVEVEEVKAAGGRTPIHAADLQKPCGEIL